MFFRFINLVSFLVALVLSAPTPHTVLEERNRQTQRWTRRDVKMIRDAVIPMSIALKQQNLDNAYDLLMDVSHPDSVNYGKHWTMEKITQAFAPSDETITAVKVWLADNSINNDRVRHSKSQGWLKFDLTVEEAETLLKTEYKIFVHEESGHERLACDEYSVPKHLSEHIEFVTPTVHMDAVVKNKKKRRSIESRATGPFTTIKEGAVIEILNSTLAAKLSPSTQAVPQPGRNFSLATCKKYITPDCLRALYGFPNGTKDVSSYGIVEFTPETYLQTDLNLFYTSLSRQIPAGTGPTVDLIDGATVQTTVESNLSESNLDLQYAISLVYPQKVTLYQTGDLVGGASFNNFLDAIDASYCTSRGGDDPIQDKVYPDTAPGGYKGASDCGTFAPASVISISYTRNEADQTPAYEERQCYEYLKLGLAGVSVLYSSGDYGVAGNYGGCCTKAKCAGSTYNSGTTGTFNPSFPATCPYITAVGATQVKPGGLVTDTSPEKASETKIYSGGGFSNVFPLPRYQSSAVATYFESYKPTYTSTQYNDSETTRGFPDVSANGADYVIAKNGSLSFAYGTSASSPVFGSVITLINEERIAAGKSTVGFLNPTLYANPDAFNDITSGGNEGCGTAGFTAVKGWDPVTGLGTPNYNKLLAVFMALS